MATPALSPHLVLGAPQLAVADLERSLIFYRDLLGMQVHKNDGQLAQLGTSQTVLVELVQQEQAVRPPYNTTGLFHVAFLFPSQRDLARTMLRLFQGGYRVGGASDHLVSQAFYLDDPDGNGIELYCDRPRTEWPMNGKYVAMDTLPLDLEGFFSVLKGDKEPLGAIAEGTSVGHMHLRVSDVAAARHFYTQVVGFDLMQANYPGAAFVAVNGYHHHLGLNEWQSRGASPAPANAVGLRFSRFSFASQAELDALKQRLKEANWPTEEQEGELRFSDPSGNPWHISVSA
jgi:catechol 2,3-dioxygenase